jgi:tetratricopeptide (TPR) repeat protein
LGDNVGILSGCGATCRSAYKRVGLLQCGDSQQQTDNKLDPTLRQAALDLAQARGENVAELSATAWKVVRAPGGKPEEYILALRRAETATRAAPWNWNILNTLGVSQYRTGALREALASLQRSDELYGSPRPMNSVFLAMGHFRLGEIDRAQAELKALRNIGQSSEPWSWVEISQFRSILHEAETLILPADRSP